MPREAKVLRARRGRGSGKGRGLFLRAFIGPVGLVLFSLLLVAAVGYSVLRSKNASGSVPASGSTERAGGSVPGTGTIGAADSSSQPVTGTGAPITAGKSPPAPEPQATENGSLQARDHIDRADGASASMLITAYFADGLHNGERLQPVEMRVPVSLSRIRLTVENLINAPTELQLFSSLPRATTVLGVNFDPKTGVATVDLSQEAAGVQGSAAANNIVASLVYTLTEIKGVTAVQLWIQGHPAILHGSEWSKPLTRQDVEERNLFTLQPVIAFSE